MYELNVPLHILVGKKVVRLNLNHYRNMNYHILNQAKIQFQKEIQQQVFALPQMSKIKIHYTVYYRDKRKFDLDNIVSVIAKFLQDSLVGAGIIEDDNYTIIIESSNSFGGISKNNPRCLVQITEVT